MDERTITSLQHPLVKFLVKLRIETDFRKEHSSLVLEGLKPIREAAQRLKKVLYTAEYASFVSEFPCEKWMVTESILQKISGMTSPEGIVAEIGMPPFVDLQKAKRVLALDRISDPGNMGTLMRTALALGWDTLYFLSGGCDPYNEKVLRAARGAHFKLSLSKGNAENLRHWVESNKVQSFVADLHGMEPKEIIASATCLLVLGNEAQGPSEEVLKFCQSITIPMRGDMESLNVSIAGGILLYLFSK